MPTDYYGYDNRSHPTDDIDFASQTQCRSENQRWLAAVEVAPELW